MATGYYLLDHPNAVATAFWAKQGKQRGYWGYPTRLKPIQGFVEHIPVALQDLTGPDPTAEIVARFFSTTARAASAHVCIDADSIVPCLPDEITAFHAKDGNSNGLGVEQGWGHLDWGNDPERDLQVMELSAKWHAPRVKKYGIPLQRVTAAQWSIGIKGFIDHSRLDPTRRKDPGPNFPWGLLFSLIAQELGEDEVSQTDCREQVAAAWFAASGEWMTATATESRQVRLSRLAGEVFRKERTAAQIASFAVRMKPSDPSEAVPAWVLHPDLPFG